MADGHPVYTQSQSNIYYQTARVSAKYLSNSSVIKYKISQTEEITICKPVYIEFRKIYLVVNSFELISRHKSFKYVPGISNDYSQYCIYRYQFKLRKFSLRLPYTNKNKNIFLCTKRTFCTNTLILLYYIFNQHIFSHPKHSICTATRYVQQQQQAQKLHTTSICFPKKQ